MLRARSIVQFVLAVAVVGPAACSSDVRTRPRCENGVHDEGEDGIDCGGSCRPCSGAQCTVPTDCDGGACVDGTCVAVTPHGWSTTDGQKNGDETDVDCGGPNAPPCAEGKACARDVDCADGACSSFQKKCVVPRNDDGIKNGTETDVDCGGQSGKKCREGLACVADTDCVGACSYANTCVEVKSCKPHLGGDTCGGKPLHPGEYGDPDPAAKHESCCRTLPVPGFTDPRNPGKTVYVDKYEITAGRVRAFVEAIAAANGGQPDIQSWVLANTPPIWSPSWNLFLPSGDDADDITLPRQPSNPAEPQPWMRNVGTSSAFGGPLYIYVHGHNCANDAGSWGFPTFWYPDAVLTGRGEVPRAPGFDGTGGMIAPKDALDVKSMTCIPNAVLAAFCHWDGGQLATDEVLDFITSAPAKLENKAGCGARCAPLASVQQSSDSGNDDGLVYRFPNYQDATHEGVARIATPGRVYLDAVRIGEGDEPWMDLHGNVNEVVLDMSGATFTGSFGLKYRGIGYTSARAGGNTGKFIHPEYKAAYAGGRCMRFR